MSKGLFRRFVRWLSTAPPPPGGIQTGGTLGSGEPRPIHLRPKSPSRQETLADEIEYLASRQGFRWTRRFEGGDVFITAEFKNGDRVVGKGRTTRVAFDNLRARLEKAR